MYQNLKRIADFFVAIILLMLFSPIFIIVLVSLIIFNDGNPFFLQKRPGKNEKIFTIMKFKTMNDKKGLDGQLLADELRLTKLGMFLRKTSLDELPQLINIVIGDMSFIGPRPLLIRYLPFYKKEECIRHSIRPGITGLAQVSGRNTLAWDLRLSKDIEYVKTLSFTNDMKIIFSTIKKVIFREDIVLAPSTELLDLDELRKKN